MCHIKIKASNPQQGPLTVVCPWCKRWNITYFFSVALNIQLIGINKMKKVGISIFPDVYSNSCQIQMLQALLCLQHDFWGTCT